MKRRFFLALGVALVVPLLLWAVLIIAGMLFYSLPREEAFGGFGYCWIVTVVSSLAFGLPAWFWFEWRHTSVVLQMVLVLVIGMIAGFFFDWFYTNGVDLRFKTGSRVLYLGMGLINALVLWGAYRLGLKWIGHGKPAANGV